MFGRPLRFLTFLAPNMRPVYEFIAHYAGTKLGCATELAVGESYEQLGLDADVGFICGLPYVMLMRQRQPAIELLAAPVLCGKRYRGQPVYFSDVIVGRSSPFCSFADLRGATWAYNEPNSHSGFGIVRYHLHRLGEGFGFFGNVVQTGWHEHSIRQVCSGAVDASAIDSQVLAIALRDHAELAPRLRVIASLGPSTIQPIVAARRLPESLKAALRAILIGMAGDPAAREALAHGFVESFVSVTDATYDDIRTMCAVVEQARVDGQYGAGKPKASLPVEKPQGKLARTVAS
ncbi:MAG TPA: PhnD/SsuA/transferrin family substrate-binding protein [Gemmataceae bacterium]|nr:PhnD/SsuA/transferrin family substrate-binding protein [Gemmataceae bacterium]